MAVASLNISRYLARDAFVKTNCRATAMMMIKLPILPCAEKPESYSFVYRTNNDIRHSVCLSVWDAGCTVIIRFTLAQI